MLLWFYSIEDWFSISHSKWNSLSLSLDSYQINYEQTLGETQSLIDGFFFFFSTLLLKIIIETNNKDIYKSFKLKQCHILWTLINKTKTMRPI